MCAAAQQDWRVCYMDMHLQHIRGDGAHQNRCKRSRVCPCEGEFSLHNKLSISGKYSDETWNASTLDAVHFLEYMTNFKIGSTLKPTKTKTKAKTENQERKNTVERDRESRNNVQTLRQRITFSSSFMSLYIVIHHPQHILYLLKYSCAAYLRANWVYAEDFSAVVSHTLEWKPHRNYWFLFEIVSCTSRTCANRHFLYNTFMSYYNLMPMSMHPQYVW